MPRSTKLAKQELRALQAECIHGVEANADNPDGSSWAIDFGVELPTVRRQAATATVVTLCCVQFTLRFPIMYPLQPPLMRCEPPGVSGNGSA